MPEEQWRPVVGFPGYSVSDHGRVLSERGRWILGPQEIRGTLTCKGYRRVNLTTDDGRHIRRKVHHLVLEAFVGPRPPGLLTRHLNGDKLDNRLANICYGTALENAADDRLHGVYVRRSQKLAVRSAA